MILVCRRQKSEHTLPPHNYTIHFNNVLLYLYNVVGAKIIPHYYKAVNRCLHLENNWFLVARMRYNSSMNFTHNKLAPMTKKRKALFASVADYAKQLKIHNYDVTVNVVFKYMLTECFGEYAHVERNTQKRFTITIDADINYALGLQTLAHEMVHVKQYIKGELAIDADGYQLWKGKKVYTDRWVDDAWEIEAMRKEVLLMNRYLASIDGIYK